jgi:hypothetical protein
MSHKNSSEGADGVGQAVEPLPRKLEALSSNPSIVKTKKSNGR